MEQIINQISKSSSDFLDILTSKHIYCTDIGDENGFLDACENYEQTMNDDYLIAFSNIETNELSGKTVYKRGTKGYYEHVLKPKINLMKYVSECFQNLDIVPVLYTFTTDTKNFASQTSAWLSTKEDMNRTLTFLRKSATGKRERIHYHTNGKINVFKKPRPSIIAYYLICEDNASHYPAYHLLALYAGSALGVAKTEKLTNILRKRRLRSINDELTSLQQLHGFGFTKISEPKKEFVSIFDAVDYMTKYLSKGFDTKHKQYVQERSIAWITCLKTTGKRLFTMSRNWKTWYNQATEKKGGNDLNIPHNANSNDNKKRFHLLAVSNSKNGQFSNLIEMLTYYTAKKPPPSFYEDIEIVFAPDILSSIPEREYKRKRVLTERKLQYRSLLNEQNKKRGDVKTASPHLTKKKTKQSRFLEKTISHQCDPWVTAKY